MFKHLWSKLGNDSNVAYIQFGDNLILFDKSLVDIVINFSKFTNLTKNIWRIDETNNLIYTLNKNQKKLYLTKIVTNTHKKRYSYSFHNNDKFDYRLANIKLVEDLEKFVSKKIEKQYSIIKYLGGHSSNLAKMLFN